MNSPEPESDGTSPGQGVEDLNEGDTLEDAARDEREYTRGRLREELEREPSEEEVNEWLRRQTEGY